MRQRKLVITDSETPQPTGIAKYELIREIEQVMAGSINVYRNVIDGDKCALKKLT
jgi:hypothetical protein